MILDTIPLIAQEVVRSIYNQSYVDLDAYRLIGFQKFMSTNNQVAAISELFSQIALVLCIVFTAFIVFVVVQRRALKAKTDSETAATQPSSDEAPMGLPAGQAGALRERWSGIVAHLDSSRETDWKVAVIEADTLVDGALARAGFPGDTFGDRLSNIQTGALLSLDGVWWAHKVRNRLAHEPDYFLRYTEARQVIGYYEAALTELQLL